MAHHDPIGLITPAAGLAQLNERSRDIFRQIVESYLATGEPVGKRIVKFGCDLAALLRASGDFGGAREAIARAYAADSTSVRAGMLEGRIEVDAGNDAAAIRAFERAARHDPDYLPEILPALLACYDRVGDTPGARAFLAEMSEHYRGISPVLALTRPFPTAGLSALSSLS